MPLESTQYPEPIGHRHNVFVFRPRDGQPRPKTRAQAEEMEDAHLGNWVSIGTVDVFSGPYSNEGKALAEAEKKYPGSGVLTVSGMTDALYEDGTMLPRGQHGIIHDPEVAEHILKLKYKTTRWRDSSRHAAAIDPAILPFEGVVSGMKAEAEAAGYEASVSPVDRGYQLVVYDTDYLGNEYVHAFWLSPSADGEEYLTSFLTADVPLSGREKLTTDRFGDPSKASEQFQKLVRGALGLSVSEQPGRQGRRAAGPGIPEELLAEARESGVTDPELVQYGNRWHLEAMGSPSDPDPSCFGQGLTPEEACYEALRFLRRRNRSGSARRVRGTPEERLSPREYRPGRWDDPDPSEKPGWCPGCGEAMTVPPTYEDPHDAGVKPVYVCPHCNDELVGYDPSEEREGSLGPAGAPLHLVGHLDDVTEPRVVGEPEPDIPTDVVEMARELGFGGLMFDNTQGEWGLFAYYPTLKAWGYIGYGKNPDSALEDARGRMQDVAASNEARRERQEVQVRYPAKELAFDPEVHASSVLYQELRREGLSPAQARKVVAEEEYWYEEGDVEDRPPPYSTSRKGLPPELEGAGEIQETYGIEAECPYLDGVGMLRLPHGGGCPLCHGSGVTTEGAILQRANLYREQHGMGVKEAEELADAGEASRKIYELDTWLRGNLERLGIPADLSQGQIPKREQPPTVEDALGEYEEERRWYEEDLETGNPDDPPEPPYTLEERVGLGLASSVLYQELRREGFSPAQARRISSDNMENWNRLRAAFMSLIPKYIHASADAPYAKYLSEDKHAVIGIDRHVTALLPKSPGLGPTLGDFMLEMANSRGTVKKMPEGKDKEEIVMSMVFYDVGTVFSGGDYSLKELPATKKSFLSELNALSTWNIDKAKSEALIDEIYRTAGVDPETGLPNNSQEEMARRVVREPGYMPPAYEGAYQKTLYQELRREGFSPAQARKVVAERHVALSKDVGGWLTNVEGGLTEATESLLSALNALTPEDEHVRAELQALYQSVDAARVKLLNTTKPRTASLRTAKLPPEGAYQKMLDAIKESGGAKNPEAVAAKQYKEKYGMTPAEAKRKRKEKRKKKGSTRTSSYVDTTIRVTRGENEVEVTVIGNATPAVGDDPSGDVDFVEAYLYDDPETPVALSDEEWEAALPGLWEKAGELDYEQD